MPICKECGFKASRLQWTHFKFKCTGKFNNGREYQAAYPGAILVDAELAKRTAVTLDTLVNKYGKFEGSKRWEEYKNKQAESNSFSYKKEKHGWSREKYDDFNKSRAVTLLNLIARHGEKEGTVLWLEYCERQKYTNTIEYYIEKYGKDEGIRKFYETCELKSHTLENVQRVHNCSREKAEAILALRHQERLKYTSHLEIEFVDALEKELGTQIHYSVKTKQYCVFGNGKANFYDIVHNKSAIEFNGDYWHCNPKKYDDNYFHPHAQLLAKDIHQKDKEKNSLIETQRQIPVLVVWESDYINNREQVIKECVNWIQKEKKLNQ